VFLGCGWTNDGLFQIYVASRANLCGWLRAGSRPQSHQTLLAVTAVNNFLEESVVFFIVMCDTIPKKYEPSIYLKSYSSFIIFAENRLSLSMSYRSELMLFSTNCSWEAQKQPFSFPLSYIAGMFPQRTVPCKGEGLV
jgi:hypothetical protein